MDEEEMEETGEGEVGERERARERREKEVWPQQEEEEVEEVILSKEMAGESLSLLAKTGSGMAHAYARMDLRDKWVERSRDSHMIYHMQETD